MSASPTSEISVLQHKDPSLRLILLYLEKQELPTDENKARRLVLESDRFNIIDGVLYFGDGARQNRLKIAAPSVIQENHSGSQAGHFAAKGVYEKLARRCMQMLSDTAGRASHVHPTVELGGEAGLR